MWRASTGVIHYVPTVFDHIPNLKTKNLEGEGASERTPAAKSLYRSIFKKAYI